MKRFLGLVCQQLKSILNSCIWLSSGLASRMKWFCSVYYRIYVRKTQLARLFHCWCASLSMLVYSLEPYTVNTKELLADEAIRKYLAKVSIVTDRQRYEANNNGNVVQPEDRNCEGTWYYPDTTKNYDKLPLMYKGELYL
jgi:hypothetical protein